MLDVPYNVKRALRLGRYKKNYKIKVYKEEQVRHIAGVMAVLSENDNTIDVPYGDYVLYNENNNHAFDSVTVTSTGGMYNVPCPIGDTETWFVVGVHGYNGRIRINGFNADEVYVTSVENISYTSENVLDFTIDNDTLIKESVKIDERMVTGKYLEFGLCEGSSLEFQYFNHPNINGRKIQVYLSVEYRNDNNEEAWYDIPMGWFDVDQCPRQFSTGVYKVTAYNKLKSDYLDAKANELLIEEVGLGTDIMVYDIRKIFLKDYAIKDYDIVIEHDENTYGGTDTYRKVYFSRDYGVESPFNTFYYMGTIDDPIYIEQQIRCMKYIIDSDIYWNIYENWGSLSDFENIIINKIKEIITSAQFYDTDKRTILTGEKYIDEKLESNTDSDVRSFCTQYGVEVRISSNNSIYFSDYAYNYAISHNLTPKVYPYSELINTTRNTQGQIFIYFPYRMACTYSYTGDTSFSRVFFDEYNHYPYYIDEDKVNFNQYYFYPIKYPNGMEYISLERYKAFTVGASESLDNADKIIVNTTDLPDFTLRDITTAVYETVCQYGKLDRETDLFTGVELNTSGLYPRDTLYPANNLYPSGNAAHPYPSTYLKLWTDTVGVQSFRYLIITYKTTETVSGTVNEVEKKLQRTVNTNGTKDYNMSDNWLFRNLIWTEEEIAEYADAMVEKMRAVKWFPFEMWSVGLPYLEAGDAIEITDKEGDTYTSYILNRQLNGIHNLQDTFINGELDIF